MGLDKVIIVGQNPSAVEKSGTFKKLDQWVAEWKLNEPLIFRHKCWVPSSTKTINMKSLDCIIVPCLGVDIKHQRLGRGSGYYDRTISGSCNTVGIISPFQQINESIGYSHDITLKEIIVID